MSDAFPKIILSARSSHAIEDLLLLSELEPISHSTTASNRLTSYDLDRLRELSNMI